MAGTLYVVGTPIGNLEDFSPRAVRILGEVDFIAAEDTRVTRKLLTHFEIKKELVSYFEHNKFEKGDYILGRLAAGESCAVVTDAGMPAISDPGEELVRAAHQNGIPVESVPGPSALVTALAISGMPSGRFCFEGFLETSGTARRERLQELAHERRTVILYEAPHRLQATLRDLLEACGDRPIALTRELTKLHETVFRTTLGEAVRYYGENQPRGEYVLILGGATVQETSAATPEEALAIAERLMRSGESASNAAREAAKATGIKKGEIYRLLVGKENQ